LNAAGSSEPAQPVEAMDKTQRTGGKRICIIGAGLTGLAAGFRLANAGYEVTLLESTLEAGGMITSFQMGSERIEYIYHHLFTSDADLERLAGELDLSRQVCWYQSREAIYAGHRLYPFSSPADLLRFRVIPFIQRLKTGLTVLKAGRVRDYLALENQTASEWLIRANGARTYQSLWQPLLRSKFDRDAEDVSAVWIWNKFRLRGGSRASSGVSRLGYMKGSFALLIDKLAQGIAARGGRILCGHTAMNISRSEGHTAGSYRISCILGSGASVRIYADAVIATVSGRQFANISSGLELPSDYLAKVRAVRYKGDLCLVLRLKRSLSPFYWTTICDESPFIVVVEHTNLMGPEPYGGHVVYLSRYLDVTDPLWNQPDGEIFRLFTRELAKVYPLFSQNDVIDWRLSRTRYAQPVIVRGYSSCMPAMNTPEPGVKLAGMAQIYPEDRGMNYAIRLGLEAAGSIERYFQERPAP
jgi:protoporphyrinogen oxidase